MAQSPQVTQLVSNVAGPAVNRDTPFRCEAAVFPEPHGHGLTSVRASPFLTAQWPRGACREGAAAPASQLGPWEPPPPLDFRLLVCRMREVIGHRARSPACLRDCPARLSPSWATSSY